MFIYLSFSPISVMSYERTKGIEENSSCQTDFPNFEISFPELSIIYIKNINGTKKITIFAASIFGQAFVYDLDSNENQIVTIISFLNQINIYHEKNIKQFMENKISPFLEKKVWFKNDRSIDDLKKNLEENKLEIEQIGGENFIFDIEIGSSGIKKLDILLQNFKMLINLQIINLLSSFVLMDDTVQIIISKSIPDLK